MKIFGLTITREKAVGTLSPVEGRGLWRPIYESFAGAWQRNIVVDRDLVLSFHAVFACMTLIASDIAKLRLKLMEIGAGGIWTETESAAFSPVIKKPNHFQNRIQFYESWLLSKLSRGNAYVLLRRDDRSVVDAMYVLDPCRVRPLISPDGSVFYELMTDELSQVQEDRVYVPSSEIIHDRFNCLFHPLVGISPLYAAGLAAMQGINIQNQSSWWFANKGMPGGVLTAPGSISDETAARLKTSWDTNFNQLNVGKIAVLGDGLKFERVPFSAEESQLIEQLKWSAEVVCSTFHVPPYKIGVGALPSFNNVQALNIEYYSQALQRHIEDIELCLDEGLSLPATGGKTYGTEFDLDGLLRMDGTTMMTMLKEAISGGVFSPNDARAKVDKPPVRGGDSVYLQQQNYSVEALAKRDAQENPFAPSSAPALPAPAEEDDDAEDEDDAEAVDERQALVIEKLWGELDAAA